MLVADVGRVSMNLVASVRRIDRLPEERGLRRDLDHVNLDEGYVLFKETRRRQLKTKYSTRKVYLGRA